MFLAGIEEQDGYPREAAATLKQMQSDAYDPGTTAEFKAELGDLIAAQQKIVQMENSHTANTMALYFDLPMLRATIDMKNHRAADAVRDLEPAQRYQMRDYGVPLMRARAEAEAGMLDKAAEDYQLVLANPGLDPIWPGHSLAHLYLAQVLARQNKLDQAQTEYRAFLEIWKDADPQIPLLTKAKQDYAQIQSRR
jgi:tetratricopeptide (TPR) repeat protein